MRAGQILKYEPALFLMLFAFFPPDYLMRFMWINYMVTFLRIFTAIFVLIAYIEEATVYFRKKYNIMLSVLFIELLLASIIKDRTTLYNWFMSTVVTLSACFFVEILLKKNAAKGLRCMYLYFAICVLINTATIFVYPEGMYANNNGIWVCWFLGEDNGAYIYYIIATMMAMLYHYCVYGKTTIVEILVMFSSFVFVFNNDIATGIACQMIWLFLFLGLRFKLFKRILKARYILYVTIGGFVFLVISRNVIMESMAEILGRNVTLTGRTIVWDRVLSGLSKNLLLGYGMISGEQFNDIFIRSSILNGILNAHNMILMLAVWGGVFAVGIFILLVFEACREAVCSKRTVFYRIVVMHIIILSIRFLVEAGSIMPYLVVFSMLAYASEFNKNNVLQSLPKNKRIKLTLNGGVTMPTRTKKGEIKV